MKTFTKRILLLATAFAFCAIFLSSCDDSDPDKGTKSTYVFEFSCSTAKYIDVTPSHGGKPSSFRLSSQNRSVAVTWEDEGDDYYGGFECISTFPSGGKAPWYQRYDALKKVVFYDH